MAFVHGKNTVVKVGTVGTPGTATDISTFCDTSTFPQTIDTPETSTFGVAAKTYIVGLADRKMSIGGKFDTALDTQLAALVGVDNSAVGYAFEYGPAGAVTGRPKYTGNLIVANYEVDAGIGDVVKWKADLIITGAVTRATYP